MRSIDTDYCKVAIKHFAAAQTDGTLVGSLEPSYTCWWISEGLPEQVSPVKRLKRRDGGDGMWSRWVVDK